MDVPLTERRRDTRFTQPFIAGTRALLRPGCVVTLVDLSAGGALIEGSRPLRPGARVHLQLITERKAFGIAAHVMRCAVSSLDPQLGVQYRGALKFDHRCEGLWEGATHAGHAPPGQPAGGGAASGEVLPGSRNGDGRT